MKSRTAEQNGSIKLTARLSGGFSLIEVLVVIAIIAVIAGMMVLSIGEDPKRSVQDESQRLYALITQIREEAILQGQLYVLQMEEDGYAFMQPDKEGKLQPLQEELFRPRKFTGNVVIEQSEVDGHDTGSSPAVVVYPTGDISVFRIILGNNGGHWQIISAADGSLKTGLTEDES